MDKSQTKQEKSILRAASSNKWHKPTEEGWYWWRRAGEKKYRLAWVYKDLLEGAGTSFVVIEGENMFVGGYHEPQGEWGGEIGSHELMIAVVSVLGKKLEEELRRRK